MIIAIPKNINNKPQQFYIYAAQNSQEHIKYKRRQKNRDYYMKPFDKILLKPHVPVVSTQSLILWIWISSGPLSIFRISAT